VAAVWAAGECVVTIVVVWCGRLVLSAGGGGSVTVWCAGRCSGVVGDGVFAGVVGRRGRGGVGAGFGRVCFGGVLLGVVGWFLQGAGRGGSRVVGGRGGRLVLARA
jgi:hypothetical protein